MMSGDVFFLWHLSVMTSACSGVSVVTYTNYSRLDANAPSIILRPKLPGAVWSEFVTSFTVPIGIVKTFGPSRVRNAIPVGLIMSFPLIFSGWPVFPWMYSTSGNTCCAGATQGTTSDAATSSMGRFISPSTGREVRGGDHAAHAVRRKIVISSHTGVAPTLPRQERRTRHRQTPLPQGSS